MNTTTATATPVQIDTELAELTGRWTAARNAATQLRIRAQQTRHADYAASLHAKADDEQAKAEQIFAQIVPLDAEFTARGGWTRAFVVADGHVHSTMDCSTCNNGQFLTEFGWVTEFSGKTEAEVIEAAGSRACTVCFPDAPVDAPAGRIFHEDEVKAQAARDERAAKAAAKAAKKAANAFGPYETSGRFSEKIKTVHAAKAFLTNGSEWGWDHPSYLPADRDAVAELLAAKLDTTAEAQVAAAAKRAANRK